MFGCVRRGLAASVGTGRAAVPPVGPQGVTAATARADSIPGLEIEANDVRCTHGATAGRVDEEMIFTAQARGIPRKIAIRLIVEGFFANVYDRITLEPVRETLREAVAAKLR